MKKPAASRRRKYLDEDVPGPDRPEERRKCLSKIYEKHRALAQIGRAWDRIMELDLFRHGLLFGIYCAD